MALELPEAPDIYSAPEQTSGEIVSGEPGSTGDLFEPWRFADDFCWNKDKSRWRVRPNGTIINDDET